MLPVIVGMAWLSRVSPATSYWSGVFEPMLLIGVGMGVVFVPLTTVSLAGVRREDSGAASSMVNVMQQVGGSLGLAVLVAVYGTATRNAAAHPAAGLSGGGAPAPGARARHVHRVRPRRDLRRRRPGPGPHPAPRPASRRCPTPRPTSRRRSRPPRSGTRPPGTGRFTGPRAHQAHLSPGSPRAGAVLAAVSQRAQRPPDGHLRLSSHQVRHRSDNSKKRPGRGPGRRAARRSATAPRPSGSPLRRRGGSGARDR